jgi:mycothiol synthase
MSAPTPEVEFEVEFRSMLPAEIPTVVALINRSEHHDGVERVVDEEEFREELETQEIDLDLDTRVAVVGGEIVGYTNTFFLPSEVRQERCYVFGYVDPSFRGRGIGRVLLGWSIDRGSEQLRSTGRDLPRYLRVDSYDFIEDAHRLYRRMGFTPVRWFEELLRPLDDLPVPVEVPGVRLEPWPAEDEGRDEEIRIVKNEAFADHWGSTPTSPQMWHGMVRGFGARPDLSMVAVEADSGRIVGYALNHRYEEDDALIGRSDAWIDNLGTLSEWRGRGIASALLVASLERFAEAGLTHASIGVDSDNPTGAARLYRNLGFEPRQRSITYEIVVQP